MKKNNISMFYHKISILLIFIIISITTQNLWSQDMSLPKTILEALKQNEKQLSPITVSSTHQYKTSLPVNEVFTKLKILNTPPDIFFSEQSRRDIWQDGKIYSWRKETLAGGPEEMEYSFNGKTLYIGQPDVRLTDGTPQPILSKQLVSRLVEKDPEARYLDAEYYDAIGLRLPTHAKDLLANKSCESEILSLVEMGSKLSTVEDVEFNGQTVTRIKLISENNERRKAEKTDLVKMEKELRSGRNSEEYIQQELSVIKRMRDLPESKVNVFYLSPKMQYAMLRREERYEDGTLLLQVNNSEFEQLSGRDVWLPRKSTVDHYTFPSIVGTYFESPILSRVIKVSEFNLNPVPDEQFVLVYSDVGTVIIDNAAPGGETLFQIPADALYLDLAFEKISVLSDLEESRSAPEMSEDPNLRKPQSIFKQPDEHDIKEMRTLSNNIVPAMSRKKNGWSRVILLNALALFAIGIFAIWRYKHRRRSTSND